MATIEFEEDEVQNLDVNGFLERVCDAMEERNRIEEARNDSFAVLATALSNMETGQAAALNIDPMKQAAPLLKMLEKVLPGVKLDGS